jgi:hypothetical protein
MDLARLRVYLAHERNKTGMALVLVVTDGAERVLVRTDGDPAFLAVGAERLLGGAFDLAAAVAKDQVDRLVGLAP